MSKSIRIKTTPGGGDKYVTLNLDQKFDFIEVLSLKLSQEDIYNRYCSDYGVIVGRVIVNRGFGVPNAKVSIFIPIDDVDKDNDEIFGLYPFETITDRDLDGLKYNLLPKRNDKNDDCYTPIGTFPTKREVIDNEEYSKIYCKYYKFTTTTNSSGDFMIFGVPVGEYYLHVDADLSDIGILSQKPYHLIDSGVSEKKFKTKNKFKDRDEDPNPVQLVSISPISVSVQPFWGDENMCRVGITRVDVDLGVNITPTAFFIGSVITDNEKNSVNKNCRARNKLGQMNELVTTPGRIEMIRKTLNGGVERFDVEGGDLIDGSGSWAYQIPMNLNYVKTSEDGSVIPSDDPTVGIPTTAKVRFRVSLNDTGGEGRLRTRAKFLIPNNPKSYTDADYSFGDDTSDENFAELKWNNIYTVKSFIPRIQPNQSIENRNFTGIKEVNKTGYNPFPFNRIDNSFDPTFSIFCVVISVISLVICFINSVFIRFVNLIILIINKIIKGLCKLFVNISNKLLSVIGSLISESKECSFKKAFCGLGTWDSDNCVCYCCDNTIPYIPYITLPCPNDPNDLDYAICGFKGSNSNGVSRKTWEATLNKLSVDDTTVNENPCKNDFNNTTTTIFHYPDDGHVGHGTTETIPHGDAGWSQCILYSIAESLEVFRFDFYNDWINGTLYAFLFKYKVRKKGRGREKFCETDCEDNVLGVDNNNDGVADNKCNKSYFVESCLDGFDDKITLEINEGLIKKYDGELYYSAISKGNSRIKLFATDIISLGAIDKCNWFGEPNFIDTFVETTHNLPPFTPEYNLDTQTIDVSGFDNGGPLDHNNELIGNLTCVSFNGGITQCNNIRRLCEFGVGLDEDRSEEGLGPADSIINNNDVDNPFIRGVFEYVNGYRPNNDNIQLVYFDGVLFSNTLSSLNSLITTSTNYYHIFRYGETGDVIFPDNSFYFYFGLYPNNNALTKFREKYLTPCIKEDSGDFYCYAVEIIGQDLNSTTPTGSITVEIVGGVKPYRFKWDGPSYLINGNIVKFPINYDPFSNTINDLYGGVYNLTVTDSIGNKTSCTFIVPGPEPLTCNYDKEDVSIYGGSDGIITLYPNGGTSPYNYEIYEYDISSSSTIGNAIESGVITGSININNLSYGYYKLTVYDSGTPQSVCEKIIFINQPQDLGIDLIVNEPLCSYDKGSAYALVSGGTTPYTISWFDSGGNQLSNTISVSNLETGQYICNVIDSAGDTASQSFTINIPPQLVANNLKVISKVCKDCSSTTNTPVGGYCDGRVEFYLNGGTPPYEAEIYGGPDTFTPPPKITGLTTTDLVVFDNLGVGNEYNLNEYYVRVIDNNGCEYNTLINIFEPVDVVNFDVVKLTNDDVNSEDYKISINGGYGSTQLNGNSGDIIGNYEVIIDKASCVGGTLYWNNLYTAQLQNGDNSYVFNYILPAGSEDLIRVIIRDRLDYLFYTSDGYCEVVKYYTITSSGFINERDEFYVNNLYC